MVGRLSVALLAVDGKASLKGAWLSHVNHLNFGGTTISLERLIVSGAVNLVRDMVVPAKI